MGVVRAVVSSAIELDARELDDQFAAGLKEACTHKNPDHARARARGAKTWGVPRHIATWSQVGDTLRLPRGATRLLRECARVRGVQLAWTDARLSVPAAWPTFRRAPRDYQLRIAELALKREQLLVRAATGSGKTFAALHTLSLLGQRACVVVRTQALQRQWVACAEQDLGLPARAVGVVGGGKRTIGDQLTVAMQQTLWSDGFDLEEFVKLFGAVVVDEVHEVAARTVQQTVSAFPARYRIGFSADERRRDRKEFLVYDAFGRDVCVVEDAEVMRAGGNVPVTVRLVPTGWSAVWYTTADPKDRDHVRLVREMSQSPQRNEVLRRTLAEAAGAGQLPGLVFTHRRDHAAHVLLESLPSIGVLGGDMVGGSPDTFQESLRLLAEGRAFGVGTLKSIGQGVDVPSVLCGVLATPIGGNRQFFAQVRGRVCRPSPGKERGYLYVLWDEALYPDLPRDVARWNRGDVEVRDGNSWGRLK